MKIDDILALSKAGFSKDEILKLADIGTSNDEPSTIEPSADAPSTEDAPDEQEPIAAQPTPASNDAIDKLSAEITRLTSIIQRTNLLNAEQPDTVKPAKAEDILANIIYPSVRE